MHLANPHHPLPESRGSDPHSGNSRGCRAGAIVQSFRKGLKDEADAAAVEAKHGSDPDAGPHRDR